MHTGSKRRPLNTKKWSTDFDVFLLFSWSYGIKSQMLVNLGMEETLQTARAVFIMSIRFSSILLFIFRILLVDSVSITAPWGAVSHKSMFLFLYFYINWIHCAFIPTICLFSSSLFLSPFFHLFPSPSLPSLCYFSETSSLDWNLFIKILEARNAYIHERTQASS